MSTNPIHDKKVEWVRSRRSADEKAAYDQTRLAARSAVRAVQVDRNGVKRPVILIPVDLMGNEITLGITSPDILRDMMKVGTYCMKHPEKCIPVDLSRALFDVRPPVGSTDPEKS